MKALRLLAALGFALLGPAAALSSQAADAVPRIPLVKGLTTIRSVAETQGDYEAIRLYTEVTPKGYRFVSSAEVPDAFTKVPERIEVPRFVPIEDQRSARAMRSTYWSEDPEVFPGTTPGVSAAIVNELRTTGTAAMTYVDVQLKFGIPIVRTLRGSVSRIGTTTEAFPILVNGRRTELRVLHAKGKLADQKGAEDFEIRVLDDPDNPLTLSATGPQFTSRMTRIEYPEAAGSANSIERKLAENQPADVYGIYFAFGSDQLKPESDRVLNEMADLLGKHRDWKLQVDGHTDNIGGDPANLDLSRRRAAAVKAALVPRYRIAADRLATGGFGAGRPKGTNETVEGRALNRRVELRRL